MGNDDSSRDGFLLGGGVREGAHPPSPGGAIFHDKQKIVRDKMRFSNLSNNMMKSEQ